MFDQAFDSNRFRAATARPHPADVARSENAWFKAVGSALSPGLVDRIRHAVFKTLDHDSAKKLGLHLNTLLHHEQERVASLLPQDKRSDFHLLVNAQIKSVVDTLPTQLMVGTRKEASGKSHWTKVLIEANRHALDLMAEMHGHALNERAGDGSVACPQVLPQGRDNQGQGFAVMRQVPPLENLVMRGGGAKGLVNGAVLIELQKAGRLDGLRQVVGSSAGALTALCLACGMSAEKFATYSKGVDATVLGRKAPNFKTRYPMVALDSLGLKSGQQAVVEMDRISTQLVSGYLMKHWDQLQHDLPRVKKEFSDAENRLKFLKGQDIESESFKTQSREGRMVTLRDLHLLHALRPNHFRQLVLTGWDKTAQKEHYFDHLTAPDMPVALAGRISMSLPVLFAPVLFDPGDGLGRRPFTDGGVGSNVPLEVVTDKLKGAALETERAKTLTLTFDDGGRAYANMHHPREASLPGKVRQFLSGNKNYADAVRADQKKVKDAGPGVFVAFHGNLKTTDSKVSLERREYAEREARWRALQQLSLRQDQGYVQFYSDARTCFESLSDPEKVALKSKAQSLTTSFAAAQERTGKPDVAVRSEPVDEFQWALYNLAKNWEPRSVGSLPAAHA